MWLQQNGQIRLKLTNLCFPWALKRSMGFQLTQTWGSSWVLPFTSRRRKASFSPFKKSAESWRTEWTDAPPPQAPQKRGSRTNLCFLPCGSQTWLLLGTTWGLSKHPDPGHIPDQFHSGGERQASALFVSCSGHSEGLQGLSVSP